VPGARGHCSGKVHNEIKFERVTFEISHNQAQRQNWNSAGVCGYTTELWARVVLSRISRRAASYIFSAALCLTLRPSAGAQSLVTAPDVQLVNRFLDEAAENSDRLKCHIQPMEPFLDFAFRFEVGYIVRCPLREFAGRESTVVSFVRITPDAGSSVVLGEAYNIAGVPEVIRGTTRVDQLKDELDFSGGFAAGEGHYVVDVLVGDKQTNRMCKKRWQVSLARKHGEKAVLVAIEPHSAVPLTFLPWNGQFENDGRALRMTVLLDAAPVYPYAQKLRAWDRSLLLSTLSTVMSQVRCESARLVAFNLDQQKEIFRKDPFDEPAFHELARAMRTLELGKVSLQVLERKQGYADLLAHLTSAELAENEPSDIVIFLGPHTRFWEKVPQGLLFGRKKHPPQFFYLEYMPPWIRGSEFPDTVEYVTKALDGTSFKIHSPVELQQAIHKILAQVKRDERQSARQKP